jgi:hypothetical protein
MVRTPGGRRLAQRLVWRVGDLVARRRGLHPRPGTAHELAEAWQSTFPSRRAVPIVSVGDGVARAEIHVDCPLRGSGDLDACHRLMAYDRAIAARAGAHVTVERSQAMTGEGPCLVAIRPAAPEQLIAIRRAR